MIRPTDTITNGVAIERRFAPAIAPAVDESYCGQGSYGGQAGANILQNWKTR